MTGEDKKKENYERLLFAIALYFANQLGIDPTEQTEYSSLTPQQKTFAKKLYEDKPSLVKQVNSGKRISEKKLMEDVKEAVREADGGDIMRIVTVGDQKTCLACAKWNGKLVSVSGEDKRYPSLDDFMKSDGLHYGCRCALLKPSTKEVERKPGIFNTFTRLDGLAFN